MSQYISDYSAMSSSCSNYSSLSNYSSNTPLSACTKKYIVPSFGGVVGYNTGYCRSWNKCPCDANGNYTGTFTSCGGISQFKNAYPNNCCGSCGSQYIQKLCGGNCG